MIREKDNKIYGENQESFYGQKNPGYKKRREKSSALEQTGWHLNGILGFEFINKTLEFSK